MPTPDWSAVLSKCRNDQVARVALLVPNEALVRKENISSNTHRKPIEPEHDAITDDTDDSHNMESESIYNSDDETDGWGHEEHATILSTGHHQRIEPDDSNKAHAEKLNHLLDLSQQIIFNNLKINNFVYEEGTKGDPSWPKVVQSTNLFYQGLGKSGLLSNTSLPSTFHAIEWASWENDISWELPHNVPMRTIADESSPSLLTKPINNILENLNISSIIDWERNDGNKIDVLENLSSCIILEHGVVGRSICHISGAIPTNFRPDPFHQSDVFERRMERELAAKSTAGGAASLGSSLQTDVVQLERIIADRQKRRAQMAIDKTNRVTDAMKTLAIGAGTGRTITSSLMGPGGTERTGRPNRDIASSAYDNEYIEQLDVVYKHIWIKAGFRLSELRFFHRPRLPRYMFESATVAPWQCQVRISHNSKSFDNRKWKDQRADGSTLVTSYQSQFMGHGGAHHQSRYRNEADLSPTEGLLILLEYSEERPPIQMLKGMASKIINYYRGDRAKCPISAGGGDRPITKKKNSIHEDQKGDKFSFDSSSGYGRLIGPSDGVDDIATIIGRSGGRKNSNADLYAVSSKDKDRQNILPEGVTELLHSKTHGPFIGTIEEGATQTGLISNLFAAPMFMHEARSTDFLLTLGKRSISKNGTNEIYRYGAILRPMPTSVFVVGQIEPRVKVYAPNSVSEKNFLANFVTFHIAKALHRCQSKDQQGLFFDDLIGRFFSDSSVPINIFRQRMKQVADYDKNTQLWTLKEAGSEDFPGLDVLGRRFSPEGVAAYESCCSAVQRLVDIGLREVFTSANCLSNFSIAIQHLSGLIHSARERKSRMNKIISRSNLKKKAMLIYEMALKTLESEWKEIKKKGEIARFIYEELQLSPWNLTSDFIDVHKNSQGSGMIKLTGFGDPSGRGEGFNFIREDTKAHRTSAMAAAEGALKEQIKKITGTLDYHSYPTFLLLVITLHPSSRNR
jgi:transcription initiation factor TFIID subunit 1